MRRPGVQFQLGRDPWQRGLTGRVGVVAAPVAVVVEYVCRAGIALPRCRSSIGVEDHGLIEVVALRPAGERQVG